MLRIFIFSSSKLYLTFVVHESQDSEAKWNMEVYGNKDTVDLTWRLVVSCRSGVLIAHTRVLCDSMI